jgi:hypothetical protein
MMIGAILLSRVGAIELTHVGAILDRSGSITFAPTASA